MSLLAFQLPAHAVQTVTLSLPDCPSGQSLTYANNTLSCTGAVSNTPSSCAITAVPTSSQAAPLTSGQQVQLTANCSAGLTPITYSWSFSGVSGILQNSLTVAPTTNTTYTVTPSNSAGPGQPFSLTVYTGTQGTTNVAPSGCSITQTPSGTVGAGSTVNLSVNCASASPAVSSCSWNQGISSTACSINVAPTATTTYTATASNSAGPASPTSATVTVGVVSNPGPGSQNFCSGSDQIINVSWPATGQVRPTTSGFGNQRIAFKITVPQTFSPALNINHLGFVHIAEVPGATVTSRDVTVSYNACDFQSGTYLWNDVGYGDTAPSVNYTANNPAGYLSAGGNFNVNSGETFYVNVRNANNGVPSCPVSSCDILFDFATPNRY